MKVKFYDEIADELLKFAVIIAKSNGKWIFCKHKERDTYEIPGGHREEQETIETTAKRELYEETGATQYSLTPICIYSVTGKNRVNATGEETFGVLYFADIVSFDDELHSEMEKVVLFDELPTEWTYPLIQPLLIEEYKRRENSICVIGKIVHVVVDRPLGSYHPEHRDMYYPVNYGYVEGIMAPDGEEQDAYILGVDEPIKEFTGKVIAIIHRYNDIEEKWVVAPEGKLYTAEQIMKKVNFTEKYFKSEIIM